MDTRTDHSSATASPTSKKTACIIANAPGELALAERRLLESCPFVIVADGALRKIPQYIRGVVVVGDFDSMAPNMELPENTTCISKPCQESSDIEKCIEYAIEQGIEKVKIVGAIGGRVDHSLVTIAMLVRYHTKLDISLWHDRSQTLACSNMGGGNGIYEFSTNPHTSLSLIPWGNSCTVSVSGVAWSLERFKLACGSQGISNSSIGKSVVLKVHSGIVICVLDASDGEEKSEDQ